MYVRGRGGEEVVVRETRDNGHVFVKFLLCSRPKEQNVAENGTAYVISMNRMAYQNEILSGQHCVTKNRWN